MGKKSHFHTPKFDPPKFEEIISVSEFTEVPVPNTTPILTPNLSAVIDCLEPASVPDFPPMPEEECESDKGASLFDDMFSGEAPETPMASSLSQLFSEQGSLEDALRNFIDSYFRLKNLYASESARCSALKAQSAAAILDEVYLLCKANEQGEDVSGFVENLVKYNQRRIADDKLATVIEDISESGLISETIQQNMFHLRDMYRGLTSADWSE